VKSVAIAVAALTLLPILALSRWTLAFKPGAGPGGGEFIFLGWFLMAGWLSFLSVAASVRYMATHEPTLFRFLIGGGLALFLSVAAFAIAFILFNRASLSGTVFVVSRLENWSAIGLFLAVWVADLLPWLR